MGNLHRTLLFGLFFTLVCVWGSYFAFLTYEKHNQEIVTLVDELENQKKLISTLQKELTDAAVKKGSVAVRVETDQKKLNSQVSLINKHGISGISPVEIRNSSGLLARRRPKHSLDIEALSNSGKTVMHVISHTHWDREWYLSFETFRGRLVAYLDKVFKRIREDENFKHFHLDGQMIPVDDYLQIREHYRLHIHEANIAGRLALGPWYVQPDEFLVSAEALVRNLQLGIKKATDFGGASMIGYIPDSFGHISQMPQLLLGFGINNAVSGRGLECWYGSEVWWEGRDGSRVLFIFLKKWYCNGLDMPAGQVPSHYWEGKKSELKNAGATTSHLLLMNGCDHTSPDPNVGSLIAKGPHPKDIIVVHSNMDDYVELVEREITSKKIELKTRTGELRASVEGLTNTLSNKITQKQANWRRQIMLERWVEPLETFAWRLGGFAYDHDTIWYGWKLLLENHPHDSICGCSAEEVHKDVDMRFEHLRQVTNQLTSTSIVRVASLLNRHRPSAQDGTKVVILNPTNIPRRDELVYVAVYGLSASPYLKAVDSQGREVAAHMVENKGSKWTYTLPDVGFRQPRTENLVIVALQATVPSVGFEIYTLLPQGQPVPDPAQPVFVDRDPMFHGVEEEKNEDEKRHANLRGLNEEEPSQEPEPLRQARQDTVGALGNSWHKERVAMRQKLKEDQERLIRMKEKQLAERRAARGEEAHGSADDSPRERKGGRRLLGLLSADNTIENEYLTVTVQASGTIEVVHKASGKKFSDVNILEDTGDSGDQYVYRRSGGTHLSTSEKAHLQAPKHFKTHSVLQASVTMAGIDYRILYVLRRGSPRVDIRVEFVNTNHNHRVRALFGTHRASKTYADGQFEVIERPIGHLFQPQCKFVVVPFEEQSWGFTLANRGLPEFQLENGHLGLTLLRGTDRIGDWGNFPVATAQEKGGHAMEYSFIPFVKKSDEPEYLIFGGSDLEARKFNERMVGLQPLHFSGFTPEVLVDMDTSDLAVLTSHTALNQAGGTMPNTPSSSPYWELGLDAPIEPNSLFDIRPSFLVLSSIKKAEDREGIIVRFFNPYAKPVNVRVYVSALLNVQNAYSCRIDETRGDPLRLKANGQGQYVELAVPKKKVVTLEFI